jgi:hypothetical protein
MQHVTEPARRIGWLFVAATVAGVLSVVVMSSTLGEDDLLAAVHADEGSVLLGQMLVFVMLVAMAGTAVLLLPVLRSHSEQLAVGYVVARTLEIAIIAVGMVAGLLLLPLSRTAAEGGDAASAAVMADSLKEAGDWTGYLGAQMVFSLSALVLNWAFLRSGLLPRWLALWGLAGVPLMFASGLLVMFESLDSHAAALNLLVVPLAVQEMVMAVWMIVRGFDDGSQRASPSEAVREPVAAR